jgi:glutathione-regulated potassium-efflux system ancillary protein KefC
MADQSLIRDAIFFLAAALVCVPIAKRLKLGSVLGYLVAGCVIGPFGLGFIRNVQSILHISELGVVLMLFVIGLELDPRRLWGMRRQVFGGGALQIVASGVPLVALVLAFGLPLGGATIAGLAIALSSTAIAVQTMRERGILATPVGRSAFSVLLFQDLAAIPLIALVPLLGAHETHGASALAVAKVVGAVLAVYLFGRFLVGPLLRVVARTGLREVFSGFALLLVLAVGEVMTLAGVSMGLGAFMAGVILSGSEYRHALETDIEPFRGLLMGLFFIAVGMSIDFGVLASRPALVAGLVVGVVGLKTATISVVGPRLGAPREQRTLLAALLSQGSEFAFVVFGVAGEERVFPHRWDAILTAVVALSMAMTPLVLLANDRVRATLGRRGPERPPDAIDDASAPVIVAGFGRFGQIVARLLFAAGIRATLLDSDPDLIEATKRFDFRVFFGNATRLDLLHQAGADQAKLLVVALDDVSASLRLVEVARAEFPNLAIVARARNVAHYLELRARGVEVIERETFESALEAGRRALEQLGTPPDESRVLADRFRAHNKATLEQLVPFLSDEGKRLSVARAAREQLEAQFAADRADRADREERSRA